MAARLCIDAGFNKLEEDPKDPELNLKKSCFWFTYSLDKSFSLSFGRAPTISDFDIATEYPIFPKTPFSDLIFVWLDIGKIQSRAYQKLYSARGKLRSSESKEHNARTLISQLQILRERCQVSFAEMDDHELEMLLPTDFSILSIMTFIYHALPQSRPSHPFQFSNECIVTAREALQAHLDVCTKFFQKPLNVIRTYVNYTLAFSPFTPFIVVLGTAISKASSEDVALLTQVVNSLETASARAHGAKKLYNICKILLQGAKTCIDQAVGNTSILRGGDASIKQRHTSHNEDTSSRDDNGSLPQLSRTDLAYQPLPSDYWHTQLNSSDDMMMLFDSYLAGNPSMMQLFETELSQFEG
ncbi:fungal specific transcription factor domain-containing protein [Phlyctema vagabunda]|uniref:Fungal specific transcription factor domain-containing protein n=1 Tax=Phlyctema vagabunda TaxID=108571 RepID=A0ABR4P490_9HELO